MPSLASKDGHAQIGIINLSNLVKLDDSDAKRLSWSNDFQT